MSARTDLSVSPLSITGTLQAGMSRWLWLIKMLLAVPHFLVLAALWVWFIISTPIAGIAILATGRYPRRLFEINTGILRWNWRVGFYVYAALGTDLYPPFTTRRTGHPATLEIDYPDRLSRPAVIVKWLLALPQIAIVALLGADILLYPIPALNELSTGPLPLGGYSVLNILVVVAGFVLMVTGRYPTGYFDFLVRISRWMYRVLIYVALMTDEYPCRRRVNTDPQTSGKSDPLRPLLEGDQYGRVGGDPPVASGGGRADRGDCAAVGDRAEHGPVGAGV